MVSPIRVVVVEDEPLYRDLLVSALVSQIPDVVVTGSFGDAAEVRRAAAKLRGDVLLTDIDLGPGDSGVALAVDLRRRGTVRGVVLLSNLALPTVLTSLPADVQGGWAYLLKTSGTDVRVLGTAIAAAAEGGVMLDDRLVNELEADASGPVARLTPRQRDVLERMARGWSNARIADDLSLKVRSVESVIADILVALDIGQPADGVHPRVAAVLVYAQHPVARHRGRREP